MTPWQLLRLYRHTSRVQDSLKAGARDWDRRRGKERQGALYTQRAYWESLLEAVRDVALALPLPEALRKGVTMKNWKTTLSAIAGLLALVVKVVNGGGLDATDIAMVSGLIGLIFAKDHNVTGGSTPQ